MRDAFDIKGTPGREVIATAVLVKSTADPARTAPSRLLLFDPSGKRIVEVSDCATAFQVATFSAGELIVLYERDGQLFLSAHDSQTISKIREQAIEVPQLK